MTEQQLFQKIKGGLPQVNWLRVENSVGTGMFDVNACHEGVEFWVELKVGTKPKLRRSQYAWACSRMAAGSRLFVVTHHWMQNSLSIHVPPFKNVRPVGKGHLWVMDKPIYVEVGLFNWKRILDIFTKTLDGTNSLA